MSKFIEHNSQMPQVGQLWRLKINNIIASIDYDTDGKEKSPNSWSRRFYGRKYVTISTNEIILVTDIVAAIPPMRYHIKVLSSCGIGWIHEFSLRDWHNWFVRVRIDENDKQNTDSWNSLEIQK